MRLLPGYLHIRAQTKGGPALLRFYARAALDNIAPQWHGTA